MRIGLVGTGWWAQVIHGPAAAAHPDWELVGVWGRTPEKVAALAGSLECQAFTDFDAFLEAVDAVVFAVPPETQAALATEAARAGKHLLLEKPLALSLEAATELVAAVAASQVASLVFLTRLWEPDSAAWLAETEAVGGWNAGSLTWLAHLTEEFLEGSPWRREEGALWDLGPHAVSVLEHVLGQVSSVQATAGIRDLVQLLFTHDGGALSTAQLSLTMPPSAQDQHLGFWGQHGKTVQGEAGLPAFDPLAAAQAALTALASQAGSGERGGPDAGYGAHLTRVLLAAESSLSTGNRVEIQLPA